MSVVGRDNEGRVAATVRCIDDHSCIQELGQEVRVTLTGGVNEQGSDLFRREIDGLCDEVCSELRTLQKKLRVVNNRNNQRKQILKPILKKHLAYQDYAQILDNLNKQVDHEYARRLKNSHSKKKKHKHTITEVHNVNENAIAELSGDAGNTISNPDSTASQQFQQQQEIQHGIADINLKKLLEKRKKWMDAIGVIFANEESEEETEHLGNKTEDDDHIPLNIKKYMVSENEFLMDGVEEIGAKSIDPAVNMKRPPTKDVFKNV